MPICKLCLQKKKLINAHIIPRAFYPKDGGIKLYKNDSHSKKIPKGIYDKKILCSECEEIFGIWDEEASRTLKHSSSLPIHINGIFPVDQSGNNKVVAVKKYNYERLKLFFVALLWRANVSKLSYFSEISLPSQEGKLRKIIQDRSYLDIHDYETFLAQYVQAFTNSIGEPPRISPISTSPKRVFLATVRASFYHPTQNCT